jgi:hypothetical protein
MTEPDDFAWIMAAYKCARDFGVQPSLVIGDHWTRHDRNLIRARWTAWQLVLDTFPHVSAAGLGRVSGFDHTTILRAMEILRSEQQIAMVRKEAA